MRIAVLVLSLTCACASAGGNKARYGGIASALARGDAPKTTSILVMRGGVVEYEQYFDDANGETLHNTRSATKSLTALAVGIALGRGVLPGLDAPAFGYLQDLQPIAHDGPIKESITLEDLLTMSSALDCDDNDPKSPGNEENMYPLPVWTRWAVDIPVRADFQRDAAGRGPFHYCTAGTLLLGQIIQRAARQPVDEFIGEHLFSPLGIHRWEFARTR